MAAEAGELSEAPERDEDICAREQIHLVGAIQPHGLVIGLDAATLRLVTRSANADALFPGTPLAEIPVWLPPQAISFCRRMVEDGRPECSFITEIDGIGATELHCFIGGGTVFCEFELMVGVPLHPVAADSLTIVTTALDSLESANTIETLSARLSVAFQALSGFERVMVWRFDADGSGEVIGESHVAGWDQSFLGLHCPASDVPVPVRQLYRRNRSRWMPTRNYQPVPLVPLLDPREQPFDLSLSRFRSVSPTHLLYQANIGADGAVSLSILQDGALWGLVIAHHRHPHRLPGATRDQIDLLVRAFALRMEALLQRQAAAKLAKDMGTYAKFLIKLAAAEDFPGALTEGRPNVRDLFSNSAGAAVVWDEEGRRRFRSLGNVPSRDDMVELTTWLHAEGKGPVFATDCLAEHFPHILAYGEMSCGVLAILFEDTRNATLLLFRPEWVQTVSWAGKPEKLAGPDGVLNLPRQSFDRWTEIHRGHSIPWQSEELDLALTLCSTINQVILRHNQASATLIL